MRTVSRRIGLWLLVSVGLSSFVACRTTPSPIAQSTAMTMPRTTATTAATVAATNRPLTAPTASSQQIQRVKYVAGTSYLVLEFLHEDLLHWEAGTGPGPALDQPLAHSPMVLDRPASGPTSFRNDGAGTLTTEVFTVQVNTSTLCFTVSDQRNSGNQKLTTLCPQELQAEEKRLTMSAEQTSHVYGLGEYFLQPNAPNGDQLGRDLKPGRMQGNAMTSFNGGHTGNAQFPIMYALSATGATYALLLDHTYALRWDLSQDPWAITTGGDQIRGYFLGGPDLLTLRTAFMNLTGRPPVPPKKMFGLWVSEYGYDDWAELDSKLTTLREQRFPLDGFVLDLQWFGGVKPPTRMGAVSWDTAKFPDPAAKLAALRTEQGIGIMLIEESYVASIRPEHADLGAKGFLVRTCAGCEPQALPGWWGTGGMLDWTNPAAGDYWHDTKRQPLINDGVLGHWTDLGEPELYNFRAWYHGTPPLHRNDHAAIHNLYNFLWLESVARGYARNNIAQRPFMMSRSGTVGIQRFGAALWSGDIASNLSSLATHFNAQMHLSFAGIDYFGSDIGGFARKALDGDLDTLYTRWFANSMLLDIPGRPHTDNRCNCHETAPDRVGDVESNLANVRLRYRLSPYLYSLAHHAYQTGAPLMPPLVMYYPSDPNVRTLGDQKLLGRDLLVATISSYDQEARDVYLPAGVWFNYHTNERIESRGQTLSQVAARHDGLFQVPLFARGGAIIPHMWVDDQTLNVLGQRRDGTTRTELIARVFADTQGSAFTLVEDDGTTTAYQQGATQTTRIKHQATPSAFEVTVEEAQGTFRGAPSERTTIIELVSQQAIKAVAVNGVELGEVADQTALEAAPSGFYRTPTGMIVAKAQRSPVTQAKTFLFQLQ